MIGTRQLVLKIVTVKFPICNSDSVWRDYGQHPCRPGRGLDTQMQNDSYAVVASEWAVGVGVV